MPPTYVIPPDDRNVGTGNPPVDVNELSDVEGLLAQTVAQLAGFPAMRFRGQRGERERRADPPGFRDFHAAGHGTRAGR